MRNFVLSEAKAGKPVVTANGNPARIICFDYKGAYPLVALVSEDYQEVLHTYTEEGRYYLAGGSINDLMMKDEIESECTAKPVRWIDNKHRKVSGFYLNTYSDIREADKIECNPDNRNVFATKRQAQSALALAQLTQIIANDPRFGGPITDDEWGNNDFLKHDIRRSCRRHNSDLCVDCTLRFFTPLAFHTEEQAELFLEENESLLKEYFMV